MFKEAILFLDRAEMPLPSRAGAATGPLFSPARRLLLEFRRQGVTRAAYVGFQPAVRGRGIHVSAARALATG